LNTGLHLALNKEACMMNFYSGSALFLLTTNGK
jgi:hypothetical protein